MKRFLKNIVDWQSLGLELGFLYPTLEKIEREQRGMIDQCKTKMLAAWLQQQDNVTKKGVPSWSTLKTALENIEEKELASEIGEYDSERGMNMEGREEREIERQKKFTITSSHRLSSRPIPVTTNCESFHYS